MIGRKHNALLAAYHNLQPLPLTPSQSTTSSINPRRPRIRQQSCRRNGYATVASDAAEQPSPPKSKEHIWPTPPNGRTHPTPYQIFALPVTAPYSKAKYYELVKIYHPDRHTSSSSKTSTSQALALERYRLIVAAHTILSDPAKRSAYDRFGAGWNGRSEVSHNTTGAWANHSPYHPSGRSGFQGNWHDPADNIWQNATWEDWEKFHSRRDGSGAKAGRTEPVYMANSYFLAVVLALSAMGTAVNYNRAQDAGTYFIEQRDLVHDRAAKDLRRVRMEASTLTTREDRIEYFLRQREATLGLGGDYAEVREEKAARVLADREVCGSEQVRERDISDLERR
ncbi:hypothetical protein TI39_contig348g00017 [Zymoseptoria brevis]|uniref:J domain-containing protein n=1 Tax=Zymoseptoria brevis TaxID=1047168 RepID=A0A0F4GR88_9PEZI|nr:hypothetical protein TI39_contig348g00017 [Zymoseptoria brevis]